MADYSVTITNGTGSQTMKAGTYSVGVTAFGYDSTTLTPTSYMAGSSASTGAFTVTASGTLSFIVNETGAEGGSPVTGGTIVMTDATGVTQYGSAVNIDSLGNAVFNNVPYGSTETPFTLHFKQLTSDDGHNPYDGVITVNMTGQTQREYVVNTPIALQTVTLTDANYTGLPIPNATMEFTKA